MKYSWIVVSVLILLLIPACKKGPEQSDTRQQKQSEVLLSQATSMVGMPNIKNFRERKLLKQIIEMRDQADVVTYTYLFSEMTGEYKFFCQSMGYGLPYATQFTNPQKLSRPNYHRGAVLPQADPNGLFSPNSATSTWVLCQNPKDATQVKPLYVEPLIIVSPFPLHDTTPKAEVTK